MLPPSRDVPPLPAGWPGCSFSPDSWFSLSKVLRLFHFVLWLALSGFTSLSLVSGAESRSRGRAGLGGQLPAQQPAAPRQPPRPPHPVPQPPQRPPRLWGCLCRPWSREPVPHVGTQTSHPRLCSSRTPLEFRARLFQPPGQQQHTGVRADAHGDKVTAAPPGKKRHTPIRHRVCSERDCAHDAPTMFKSNFVLLKINSDKPCQDFKSSIKSMTFK